MKWEKVRLGDVCFKIGSGATPKGGSIVYTERGVSLIRSQNIYNLRFEYEGLAHITDNAAQKLNGVTICKNDVLINITGDSVARTCIVPANVLPARVNQHVAIIRPNENQLIPQFLNYYLVSPYMQSFMLGLAVGKGASRNAMTKDMIAGFRIPCPPIYIQEKIASILSAYDDLIENNRRQIKLLEEAAQRLYKEWFVDLRFPGHEKVKIVDGVPEGWEIKMIGDCFVTTSGGTPNRAHKEYFGGNYLWLKTQELHDSYIFDTEEKITEEALNNSSTKLIPSGSLIVAMYGATIGKMGVAAKDLYCNQACCAFLFNDEIWKREFLYCWLLNNRNFLISQGKGSAQPNLSQAIIKSFRFILPALDIIKSFSYLMAPLFKKKEILENQIQTASQSRDRLLPKLMSGEVEV